MDIIIYNGETYKRRKDKWADSSGLIAHDGLQDDLNKAYAQQLDPNTLPLDDCIAQGDSFKKSSSYSLALKFYEAAVEKADFKTMSYILPRMTSCYRKIGQPQKSIDILTYASKTFGKEMITSALLTSAAAAYCDLGDSLHATLCYNKAYAKGGNSDELSLVYKRIQSLDS